MPLTDRQIYQLMSASVLLQTRSAELVSEFEAETIAAVGGRFVLFRRDAIVSDAEWRVIDDAVAAMRKATAARNPSLAQRLEVA